MPPNRARNFHCSPWTVLSPTSGNTVLNELLHAYGEGAAKRASYSFSATTTHRLSKSVARWESCVYSRWTTGISRYDRFRSRPRVARTNQRRRFRKTIFAQNGSVVPRTRFQIPLTSPRPVLPRAGNHNCSIAGNKKTSGERDVLLSEM